MAASEWTTRLRLWRVGAIITVALVINALSLAPATHDHDGMHDASHCPVCIMQATGAGMIASSVVLPAPTINHDAPTSVERVRPTSQPTTFSLIRAPPPV